MSKKVIYFNDDEILKGGDMDSIKSNTNHNTLLTSNSNIHIGGGEGNKVVKEGRGEIEEGEMTNNNDEGGGEIEEDGGVITINDEEEAGEEDEEEAGEEGEEDNCGGTPLILRGGASESTQLNRLVEQLLATNMAKISNQLTSQSGGGLNITDVLSGINEQLSNLNTNIGKIIQLNNKNI